MHANAFMRFDLIKRDWRDFYAAQLVRTNPTLIRSETKATSSSS
jgi:hypothetical protein